VYGETRQRGIDSSRQEKHKGVGAQRETGVYDYNYATRAQNSS